jgi:prevent-host-death family protein
VFVNDPNHKGNVAELAIATEAARLGLSVLKPLTEHERYDLVLGVSGKLLRVQCKWATRKGDAVLVSLSTSWRGPNGYIRGSYSATEFDAVGAYCEELKSCFLIPIEDVDGRSAFQMRLAPARNGQRAALNWADRYRLGAVAQLAERRRGTAEARGSNPLSSTSKADDVAPTDEEVGAHEFRNHFGLYMERAAHGAEILIRRRGTPYARLGPPILKPLPVPADD